MSANGGAECSEKAMVLFATIESFCIKTKNPIHRPEKVGFFAPLHSCLGP